MMHQSNLNATEVSNTLGQWSAILCSIAAASIGTAAIVLRVGLVDPWLVCGLLTVGISWLLLNGPVLLQQSMVTERPSLLWNASLLTLMFLLGTIVFCWCGGLVAGSICASVGFICFVVNLSQLIRQNSKRVCQVLVICGLLSGIACAGISWGRGYLSPVYDEGLSRGYAYKDSLFHMSISNMIRTHGTPSTGLDGVPRIPYHWGSHLALGSIADGISATSLQAYNLIFPVVFGPLFIHCLLLAGIACGGVRYNLFRERLLGKIIGLWALVMVALVGFLPSPVGNEVGLRPSFMVSESMAVAIILSALGIGVIFPRLSRTAWFSLQPQRPASKNPTFENPTPQRQASYELWLAAICLPVFAGALGTAKISLLVICGAMVFYVILRSPSIWKRPIAIGSLLLTLLTALLVLRLCYASSGKEAFRFEPFYYLTEYVSGIHRPFFFPVTLAWLALAFYLRFQEMRITSWRRFLVCLRSRRMIDLELLVVAAGVGYAVSMSIPIGGGSGVYFHNVQQWIAVVIVLGAVMRHRSVLQTRLSSQAKSLSRMLTRPWGDSAVAVRIATGLVIVFLINVTIDNVRIGEKLTQSRFGPTNPSLLALAREAGESEASQSQAFAQKQALMAAFDHLSAMTSREQKRNSAVWIPKSNSVYWTYLGESKNALAIPFLAPALIGMAMVDGAPDPHPRIEFKNYGFLQYNVYDKPQLPLDERELESRIQVLARRQGFKRVLKIEADHSGVLISEWRLEAVAPLLATGQCLVSSDHTRRIAKQPRSNQAAKHRW